ncbi:hypothetical protein BJY52DRAFT_1187477 [Lactarius psammicola]|nr:hypothetical protein BJY52DRAFT_1187477 [Lactarius psammicola]
MSELPHPPSGPSIPLALDIDTSLLDDPPQSRLLTLLDCCHASRVPTLTKLLYLIDIENPVDDLIYADMRSELDDFGMTDAVDIYSMPVELLALFSDLSSNGVWHLYKYCCDKLLAPLGFMEMRCESEEASVEEVLQPEEAVTEWLKGIQRDGEIVKVVEAANTGAILEDECYVMVGTFTQRG